VASPSVIAIDVAILVPDQVAEPARTINRALAAGRTDALRLDSTHLPHITLAQQFVERVRFDELWRALDGLLRHAPALPLRVAGVTFEHGTVQFAIDPAADLLRLHDAVIQALEPFEAPGGGPDAFQADGETIRPRDVAWVRNFRSQASCARFRPHVTLGHADRAPDAVPIDFVAKVAAACHLGRFCTCRTVLRQWRLR